MQSLIEKLTRLPGASHVPNALVAPVQLRAAGPADPMAPTSPFSPAKPGNPGDPTDSVALVFPLAPSNQGEPELVLSHE